MHINCSLHIGIMSHLALHVFDNVDTAFKLFKLVLNEKCGNSIKTRLRFSAVLVKFNFGIDIVKTTKNMAIPMETNKHRKALQFRFVSIS